MPRYTKAEFAKKENKSIRVIESWIRRYGLPCYKIGRLIYIDDADFETWWKEHRANVPINPPVKSLDVAIPVQCRKPSIAHKMRKIY